jgi:hypothetical protein
MTNEVKATVVIWTNVVLNQSIESKNMMHPYFWSKIKYIYLVNTLPHPDEESSGIQLSSLLETSIEW